MDKKNYPAAHSMDTHWFAVDLEGNIGYFDTGESGALPSEAFQTVDGIWKLLDLLPKDDHGLRHFPLPGRSLDAYLSLAPMLERAEMARAKFKREGKAIPSFLFNDMAIEFKSKKWKSLFSLPEGTVRLHPEREVYYLGFRETPEKALELLELGEVKGVILNFTDDEVISKVIRSFYYDEKAQYSHGRGISDYERMVHPDKPAKLSELPSELHEYFTLKLPVRFADLEMLQPLEYVKARAWEPYYINEKGEKIDYDFDRDS